MDTQSLPFFHPLGMIPQEAEEKNTLFFPLSSPPREKAAHWSYPSRHVTPKNEEEAVENWALIASCFLEHGVGMLWILKCINYKR